MNSKFYNTIIIFFIALLSCNNTDNTKNGLPNETVQNETTADNALSNAQTTEFQTGDIIFQTSTSDQSKAIQLATKSKYSHVGIIVKNNKGILNVFEAYKGVDRVHLDEWIARGENSKYVVKRLINSENILTTSNVMKLRKYAKTFKGKNYDAYFNWSDDEIYCSELVWKLYKNGLDIELGKLQKLGDLDLSDTLVKQKLSERYGNNIPLNENIITPAAIFNSPLLETVFEN